MNGKHMMPGMPSKGMKGKGGKRGKQMMMRDEEMDEMMGRPIRVSGATAKAVAGKKRK